MRRFPDGQVGDVVATTRPTRQPRPSTVQTAADTSQQVHIPTTPAGPVSEAPASPGASIPTPLLLTAAESAALCHVCLRTWRAWDAMGKIPQPVRIGRSVFWRPQELAAWVEEGCPRRDIWQTLRN
jgi:predicted DNA-binding transcriptional regulator AlpA